MKAKIYALEANNTWALTNIPLEKIQLENRFISTYLIQISFLRDTKLD